MQEQIVEEQTNLESPGRRALIWLGGAGLLATLWQAGRGVVAFLTPPITRPRAEPIRAGAPSGFAQNSLTFLPAAAAWLGRDAGGFFALSAVCPHLGCTVQATDAVPGAAGYRCPCHGSRFDGTGAVLSGPAVEPLRFLAVCLEEGELLVDPAQAVPPETRTVA